MMKISFVRLRFICLCALLLATSNCSSTEPVPPSATKVAPPAPVASRDQDTIEYLADDGTPRTAWLEEVEVKIEAGVVVNTIDPDWRVKNSDGTTPRVKEFRFTATDGTARIVWVECHYDRAGDYVDCKFKNAKADPWKADERSAQEDIWLLDRNRNPFRLTISRIWGGPPRVPKFFIGY